MIERRQRSTSRGFTLLEVMLALGVLAAALTVLIRSVATNVHYTAEAESLTVVTNLARAKMFDVEEQLIQDGFLETDQSSEGDFGDDGWPAITWVAKVEKSELPSIDTLTQMQQQAAATAAGSAAGSGAGSGGDPAATGGFGDSALGGMMMMFGGGTDAADAAGGSMIQQNFQMVQEVLEASIRKVTITVKYQVLGTERELGFVLYVTDPAGMNKVLGGLGASPQNPTEPTNPTNPTNPTTPARPINPRGGGTK